MLLKAKEIQKKYRIHHDSLLKWEREGKIEPRRTAGGHRRWLEQEIQDLLKIKKDKKVKRYAIYARCSTQKQKNNLEQQIERLKKHCEKNGYKDVKQYSEIGSGLNDNRRQLHKLIDAVLKGEVNHIVVEYKDRLARYGYKFLMWFFKGLGCELEYLEDKATKDDNEELVKDVLSLFTCFSARLYGKRDGRPKGSKNKKKELAEKLEIRQMPKYKYNIRRTQFNSKKSVIEYVRENIHSKYPDHQSLSDEHLRFMVALLRHHPWSDQKIGVGVRKMWIQPNENYPTRGFWLEREDGTKTDFSFYKCVSLPSPLRDFKEACRRAIAPFVIDFRQRFFQHQSTAICPVLGKSITIHSSHVDHAPPKTFEKIVSDFIKVRNVDVEKAPLMEHDDGKIGNRFVDDGFENDWINFHNKWAKLRVISVKANLSASKKSK